MKAGILIGQLNDSGNESALIRTAEALGIFQVHIVNGSERDIRRSIARGAEQHVSIHHWDSYKQFAGKIKERNQSIVAIENTDRSVPIEEEIDYPVNPIFVTGNEGRGVPAPIIEHADAIVKISQSVNSYTRCLNTTVAGSIVMHDWFRHRYQRDKTQSEFAMGTEQEYKFPPVIEKT